MTIAAQSVYRAIQKKFKDNNESFHNEYETLDAINEAIRYTNNVLALRNSDFLEKSITYNQDEMNAEIDVYNAGLTGGQTKKEYIDLAEEGIDLPEDFVSMISIVMTRENYHMHPIPAVEPILQETDYKIIGNKLFAGSDCTMLYKKQLTEVKNLETESIDLPYTFFDLLVKIAAMILVQDPNSDVLLQTVTETVNQIVPRRRYSNARIRMPWTV